MLFVGGVFGPFRDFHSRFHVGDDGADHDERDVCQGVADSALAVWGRRKEVRQLEHSDFRRDYACPRLIDTMVCSAVPLCHGDDDYTPSR